MVKTVRSQKLDKFFLLFEFVGFVKSLANAKSILNRYAREYSNSLAGLKPTTAVHNRHCFVCDSIQMKSKSQAKRMKHVCFVKSRFCVGPLCPQHYTKPFLFPSSLGTL